MLEALGGETETVIVVRESHWAVGGVEWIAIHEADAMALAKADEQCERLADYPVLNEEDWSGREFEAQCATWANAGLQGQIEYCKRAGISIFAARRGELPEDDGGRLGEFAPRPLKRVAQRACTRSGAHAGSNPNHPIGGDDGRGYQQRTACQTPRKQGHGHSRVHNYPPRWNGAPIRRK
jgi:hypothetical protein